MHRDEVDSERSDEVPESDALEQRREVDEDVDDEEAGVTERPDSDDFEVPEADAYEQTQQVSWDDDDWR